MTLRAVCENLNIRLMQSQLSIQRFMQQAMNVLEIPASVWHKMLFEFGFHGKQIVPRKSGFGAFRPQIRFCQWMLFVISVDETGSIDNPQFHVDIQHFGVKERVAARVVIAGHRESHRVAGLIAIE